MPTVLMDKDQIQQAVINLILNATDATDSGGTITVLTQFIPQNKVVEIAISDTGKGISGENTDKIFEPFFTTKGSGTGLGLAITHGIIGQHGGTIDVKSNQSQGTTFTIRLPQSQGKQNGNS
jgi:signal transduction histidine kinase